MATCTDCGGSDAHSSQRRRLRPPRYSQSRVYRHGVVVSGGGVVSDQNNPMKPSYEKPRKGRPPYSDRTADLAVGRADRQKRPWVKKPQWGPDWKNDD